VALSEDGRTLSFRFVRGEVKLERQVKLATLIYRGVWREGEYERGDVVTWGGSVVALPAHHHREAGLRLQGLEIDG
jgi:hypothetical protein